MTSRPVVIDDAVTIRVIIITIAIACKLLKNISKSFESDIVPRERCKESYDAISYFKHISV